MKEIEKPTGEPKVKIYKKVTVKKLYRGHASVRDYIVLHAITHGLGLKIKYQDHLMTVPVENVTQTFQFHRQNFTSKYKIDESYTLIDFAFVPDSLKE